MPSTRSASPAAAISPSQRWTARHGPSVCDDDGPTPILSMSKTLSASAGSESAMPARSRWEGRSATGPCDGSVKPRLTGGGYGRGVQTRWRRSIQTTTNVCGTVSAAIPTR